MSWKNWSYTKKGGVIGLGLYIIVNVITLSLSLFLAKVQFVFLIFIFTAYFPMAFLFIELFGPLSNFSGIIIFLLINSIFWFVVGSLTGWIYGKIKSRNKGVK